MLTNTAVTLEAVEKWVVLWLPVWSHKGQDMLDILLSFKIRVIRDI